MALRTFTAISMLVSLTLFAPASFARGGHGGGGHGGGGHSSGGHSSGGHSSFGGHSSSSSSHASGFGGTGHASFRGGSESSSSSSYGSGHSESGRSSYAGGHGDTWGSNTQSVHPAIMHTMPQSQVRADPAPAPVHVVGSLRVEGRVRASPTPSTVGGAASSVAMEEDGWAPRYRFRVAPAYATYYTPYSYYADSTYWVTDWVATDTMVADEMEGPGDVGAPPMEASVKEELREEIVGDMSAPMETEASADDPRIRAALANPSHIFLVSKELGARNQKGVACALRPADVVRPLARVAPEDQNVSVVVLAAKGGGCAPGEHVTVAASDLATFERELLTRVDQARAAATADAAARALDGTAL